MRSPDFSKVFSSQIISVSSPLDPSSPWYVYAATCVEATGSPTCPAIGDLWKYITTQTSDTEDLVKIARRIREGLLKCSVLVGFPRGINALSALSTALSTHSPDVATTLQSDRSLRSQLSADELNSRGQEFFSAVYSVKAEKVQSNMAKTSGGDLDQFAILSVYGELMAETGILDAKETGLLEFLACYVTGATPQANGHMYGSRNLGNTKEEIQTGVKLVKAVVEQLGVNIDFEDVDTVAKKMEKW